MSIVIIGDLAWTGALVLFLEALDGGPAADVAGYAFESSGTLEYACTVPEPLLPADRLLGTYRCVAETAGGVPAGVGYVTIAAETTTIRIRSEASTSLDPSYDPAKTAATQASVDALAAVVANAILTIDTQVEAY